MDHFLESKYSYLRISLVFIMALFLVDSSLISAAIAAYMTSEERYFNLF